MGRATDEKDLTGRDEVVATSEERLPYEVGRQIRRRRGTMGLSLRELSERTGLSASSLSQIERGIVSPTLKSLTAIARALDVPLFSFFIGNSNDSPVIRRGQHPRLQLPGSNVHYELISRRNSSSIAVMRARLQAGRSVYDEPQAHPQEECLYVLQGKMRVTLGDTEYVLGQHDAISFDGNVPHLLTAIGGEEAEYILSISPVVF